MLRTHTEYCFLGYVDTLFNLYLSMLPDESYCKLLDWPHTFRNPSENGRCCHFNSLTEYSWHPDVGLELVFHAVNRIYRYPQLNLGGVYYGRVQIQYLCRFPSRLIVQ